MYIDLSSAHAQWGSSPSAEGELGKQTLLVVDDYKSNLDVMNALFKDQYRVILHNNAKDAINCAVNESVDLILLDIDMPGIDGYDACVALKKNPDSAHIPVIFVTASGSSVDEEKGLSLGAVDYVAKPVNFSILRARVKNHMELVSYRKKLEVLSCVDGLTGTSNRRQLDIMLQQNFASAIRFGHSLVLLMIDIDNFKPFNDLYGHAKGDDCLKQVAKTIMSVRRRETDIVGRYGGEEFAVILPNTDIKGGLLIANKLLDRVRKLAIEHAGNDEHKLVTFSIGLAALKAQQQTRYEGSLEEFVKEADDQLYRAKFIGKNCVSYGEVSGSVELNE